MKTAKNITRHMRALQVSLNKERANSVRLEEAWQMAAGLSASLTAKLVEERKIISDVAEFLGANSAALPPREVEGGNFPADMPYRLPGRPPAESSFFRDARASSRAYWLHQLQMAVNREAVDGALHIRFRLADGTVGYRVSLQALRKVPREQMVERMAFEMAQLLVRELADGSS